MKKKFLGEDSWFKRSYLIFDERNDLCHTIFELIMSIDHSAYIRLYLF